MILKKETRSQDCITYDSTHTIYVLAKIACCVIYVL